jgi:hypothetical protein
MTGDHRGQTPRRATLQVTAADEILGTHTSNDTRRYDLWLQKISSTQVN